VLGVPTNADYLSRVMDHPEFMAGRLHTGFVIEHAGALAMSPAPAQERVAAIVAAALEDVDFRRTAFGVPEPYASMGGWRN
jgi:propionyl-CoA carboxylase alpha chain/3-methylcrotonyl-CoA carboxylase alpha subunit/acetyl-CoA/propionyl-CoA carboxylase biotin carboxyl carrier protein